MSSLTENWLYAFVEITNRCNFDCVFCTAGISARPKRDMDRNAAFRVIDQLHQLDFRGKICFHVLGEPLLHPDVFGIVDHAAEVQMTPLLFTNGCTLTQDVVERIMASRASELVISMQTISRESYETLRRASLDWESYLRRIQEALAQADEAEAGPAVRVSAGVRKPDPGCREDLYFAEQQSPAQVKQDVAGIFARAKGADLARVFAKLDEDDLAGVGVTRVTDRLSLSVKPMGSWRRMWRDQGVTEGVCPLFGKEIAVLSNGAVTFCHLDYDGRTAFGNVHEASLPDILVAPEFTRAAEEFTAGTSVPKGCTHCRNVAGS